MSLASKIAIVTGGAMGIGFAVSTDLAGRGVSVVIADVQDAAAAANRLREEGRHAIGVKVDVSSEMDTNAMAAAAVAEFGGIDILVNNAGIYSTLLPRPFEDIDPAEWRRVMEVNTMGIFLCSRAVLAQFKARGGGRIINVSSGVAFKGNPFMAHYVASKGAVVSLTRAMATELGRYNVLVNSVAPGFTMSEGVERNPALGCRSEGALAAGTSPRTRYAAGGPCGRSGLFCRTGFCFHHRANLGSGRWRLLSLSSTRTRSRTCSGSR
jgi:NAD(P)-dependent dehydrogenase (short-subunit alcohol dehydrogenase family)